MSANPVADELVRITPVQRPGGPSVPRVVLLPQDRWRQWLGDLSAVAGGSFLKLLSDDEWPLDGAYLALGLHADDCPAPGVEPNLTVHGGLTAAGPVAVVCAEWAARAHDGATLVFTVLDAGEPAARTLVSALAEQEEVPLLLCEASSGAFIAQSAVATDERWRLRLRRVLAETTGSLPCGDRRPEALALVREALTVGTTVPTRQVVGRNDPCPCTRTAADGRPRKFKRCCGAGA